MDGRKHGFPNLSMSVFLLAYGFLMTLALPFVLAYFRYRGIGDPLYSKHMLERFGVLKGDIKGAYWVHAASLGEVRSAWPLIDGLLARSRKVVVTVITPAGRREALGLFAEAVKSGELVVCYAPLEHHSSWARFFRTCEPTCGLVMEVDLWPRMIASSKRCGVPLFMCNAQYPKRSFERDLRFLPVRAGLVRGFTGIMAKSAEHAVRFVALGARDVRVVGELRFDIPVPSGQVEAGLAARETLCAKGQKVVGFASVIQGEEDLLLSLVQGAREKFPEKEMPFFVAVPRAPERFGHVAAALAGQGLRLMRRSDDIGADMVVKQAGGGKVDVLVGDSTGEMHFYMAMCDLVIVGGGFTSKGSHNIIEALCQRKAVIVGPETWTIDYPLDEALAAGVVSRVDRKGLLDMVVAKLAEQTDSKAIDEFVEERSHVTERTLGALDNMLEQVASKG